jgi:predicted DNA-binding transcriptional regulator AlpA
VPSDWRKGNYDTHDFLHYARMNTTSATTCDDKLLSLAKILPRVGNPHRSTIWRWIRLGIFPKPKRLGPRKLVWYESEITRWLDERRAL